MSLFPRKIQHSSKEFLSNRSLNIASNGHGTRGASDMIVPDDFLEKLLEEVGKAEEAQRKARASDRPIAILTPIVPIRFDEADSWFGGKPRLPKEVPWPEEDGQPFRFACQINLRNVPRGIWSGAGPREGWLVVFLHWDMPKAKVLHVHGELEERDGPGQMSAQWARMYTSTRERVRENYLPRWPIHIKEVRQNQEGDTTTDARSAWTGWEPVNPDLADPGTQPFDTFSLAVLLDHLGEYPEDRVKNLIYIHFWIKLRQPDLAWVQKNATIASQTLIEFIQSRTILASSLHHFDQESVTSQLSKLSNLPTYELTYDHTDEEGFRILEYRTARLSDPPVLAKSSPLWWAQYTGRFYWMCVNAYTRNPDTLSPAVRRHMEQVWTEQAGQFQGAMGHAPDGYMEEAYGPDSDTEVLLQLPTSVMQGWTWGDCNTIVLLIKRQALDQGDFSTVEGIITN